MSDIHNRKTVNTRKEHRCEGCFEIIPKGTKAEHCKGKWDGRFYDYHLCEPCRKYMDTYMDDLADTGFMPGEIKEFRMEAGA